MLKTIILNILFFLFTFTAIGQDSYQVYIDLNKATADRLQVQVQLPTIREEKALFVIPEIIPGT